MGVPVRRIAMIALFATLAFSLPEAAHSAQRLAFVVGNSSYRSLPRLANPVNDANAIARRLKSLGFEVIQKTNVRRTQIGALLLQLKSLIQPGAEVIFYYAGHGAQIKGSNYLLAVDADVNSEFDVPPSSFNLSDILGVLEDSKASVKLVILDACRNNPLVSSSRGIGRGLARLGDSPAGTLVSYATRPGGIADDGDGANGLFTAALLKHMATPGLQIELMLKRVAADVYSASSGRQEPWIEGNIRNEFILQAATLPAGPQLAAARTDARSSPEKAASPEKIAPVSRTRVPPPTQTKPSLRILAVGISKYRKPEYSLTFAAKDANDFVSALLEQRGSVYGSIEARNLIDDKATLQNIHDGLAWLAEKSTAGGVSIVFLAGHALKNPMGQSIFLAWDSDFDNADWLELAAVRRYLDGITGTTVAFWDFCDDYEGRRANQILFYACSRGQIAEEHDSFGGGLFAKALVEGLSGPRRTTTTEKDSVSVRSLDEYVKTRVSKLSEGRQTPIAKYSDAAGRMRLSKIRN